MSSDFKNKYRDAIPYLNNLCYENHPINLEISRTTYVQLIYQHTIHLIRWYAMFRNEGRYSVDAYVTVYKKLKHLKDQRMKNFQEAKALGPTLSVLLQASKKQKRYYHAR